MYQPIELPEQVVTRGAGKVDYVPENPTQPPAFTLPLTSPYHPDNKPIVSLVLRHLEAMEFTPYYADVFSSFGLGLHKGLVLLHIETGPRTTAEIVKLTGMNTRTIQRYLAHFRELDLITSHRGVHTYSGRNLRDVAAQLGTIGKAEERKRRHEEERRLFFNKSS